MQTSFDPGGHAQQGPASSSRPPPSHPKTVIKHDVGNEPLPMSLLPVLTTRRRPRDACRRPTPDKEVGHVVALTFRGRQVPCTLQLPGLSLSLALFVLLVLSLSLSFPPTPPSFRSGLTYISTSGAPVPLTERPIPKDLQEPVSQSTLVPRPAETHVLPMSGLRCDEPGVGTWPAEGQAELSSSRHFPSSRPSLLQKDVPLSCARWCGLSDLFRGRHCPHPRPSGDTGLQCVPLCRASGTLWESAHAPKRMFPTPCPSPSPPHPLEPFLSYGLHMGDIWVDIL